MTGQTKAGIVTGAASGLGEAAARRLIGDGHAVLALDRDAEGLDRLARELASPALRTRVCDIADEDATQAACADGARHFGAIGFLVNSAGIIAQPTPLRKLDASSFDAVLAVNLRGTMLMMKAALASMREAGGGSIVNIGSVASIRPSPFVSSYSASKYGVAGLTMSVAVEEAGAGIRVNAICPGFIRTPMYDRFNDPAGEADLLARIPMGRTGDAAEIANLVSWLVGPQSTYVTGQLIAVDGGVSLT